MKTVCSAENPLAQQNSPWHNDSMYLRRHRKKSGGVDYETWTLVESERTAKGPRQRIVATIGKLPGLDREERIRWEAIGRILDGPRAIIIAV